MTAERAVGVPPPIGNTKLLFTDEDFDDRESALSHYKKVGERMRSTRID